MQPSSDIRTLTFDQWTLVAQSTCGTPHHRRASVTKHRVSPVAVWGWSSQQLTSSVFRKQFSVSVWGCAQKRLRCTMVTTSSAVLPLQQRPLLSRSVALVFVETDSATFAASSAPLHAHLRASPLSWESRFVSSLPR